MTEVKTRSYNNHKIATAFHDAGGKNIVIFCHGYRGESTGPNRFFVRVANLLAEHGISSLRFDQYGSGNSDGDFYDSCFDDWVATTKAIAQTYLTEGYRVALFGQSMGASTVITAGAELPDLQAVVAWVPDPSIGPLTWPQEGYMEESGQRVQASFWQEAHDAAIANKLARLQAPAYIVQCTNDEYVDALNRSAIEQNTQPHHQVVSLEGYAHSNWSFEQASKVIDDSVKSLLASFS